MADSKIKIALLAASLCLCAGLSAQDFHWQSTSMDGHRAADVQNLQRPMVKRVKALVDKVQPDMAELKTVVGYSDADMSKYGPESPLSNWLADLMLVQAPKYLGQSCDISISNFGGIRVDMPKGDVLVDDVRSMFPFKNNLILVKQKGSNVRKILDDMARKGWQVLGGVKIVASRQGCQSILVGGQPLDDEKIYSISTNSFLLYGGDGLYLAEGAVEVKDSNADFYVVVMDYLATLRAEGKHIAAQRDGRITLTDAVERKAKKEVREDSRLNGWPYVKGAADAAHKLNILHTNDTHSHIDPVRAGADAGRGGILERAVFVDSVRRADGRRNVLLVDAGDFEQGTPYFSLFRGKVEIGTMNRMGYDAATLGNHEFDNGLEDLKQRMKKAKFKVVLSNYDLKESGLDCFAKPYTIIRRGGYKIGILGALTDVTSVVDADIAKSFRYQNPVNNLNKLAAFLKEEKGCDLVIVLSHLGITGPKDNPGDIDIAPYLKNVDYIIGGHTHTNLPCPVLVDGADGKPVVIVTNYCWGLNMAEIKIN